MTLIERLRALDGAKKHYPSGPGGQMMGCESYRLVATGFTFQVLQEAADALETLQAENERLNDDVAMHMRVAVKAIDEVVELKAERDTLAAKLVPLEADAERLNWIESKTHPSITIFKHFKGYKGYAFRFDDKSIGFEGSIRQAIDAAKGGQHD